ncbi:MAG: glycyl-radical enzyme activating protein [Odoribacter sp.]|nr:glycyl-radical enzyme activating protein [Odoribacter sp.]
MKGLIFSIKRYAIHDGPGIRVTFFMKGCPLSCRWCHNPEGISPEPATIERVDRIGEKEFKKNEEAGKFYDTTDILAILEKERVFINQSKGGVTFSGGEPMMQFGFLLEALQVCKENGFHTTVDTSGFSTPERFQKIIPFTDLFLFDIKHLDTRKHKEYTGVPNDVILSNYRLIVENGSGFIVRIPVIPGFNDDAEHLVLLKKFILGEKHDNLKMISLLPYHKIGSSKYKRFNIPYGMDNVEQPSFQRMKELKEYFSGSGVKVKVGG